jgi:outer membrane protein OmpA-like peptidoglycan-associated protein
VRVTDGEIVILDQVQFKTGSAVILKASDDLLQQVSAVLIEHPEILKVEVQGHTDNRGGKKYNQKLSEKRSASVVKWLVKKGNIDATRLTSHGYGMEEPITDNDTSEGRQKNRRVQFKILDKASK